MRIVDHRMTDTARDEFRATYRFVEWDRADVYFDGFDQNAIEHLFAP
jgi:hypothetical protein